MQTFTERSALVQEMFTDPELDCTTKEFLVYFYHWYKYESSLNRLRKATRHATLYSKKLNDQKDIFFLRKEMRNL